MSREDNESEKFAFTDKVLLQKMKEDVDGADKAFDDVFEEVASHYFVVNPKSSQREEIEAIARDSRLLTPEQISTAFKFLYDVVGIDKFDFDLRVMDRYAKNKGYILLRN